MTGNAVFVGLTPDGFRLGLNACNRVKYRNCTVQNAERTLNLYGKVNVTRRIDDVNAVVFQKQVVAAEVMVMPRSCSCSIQSMVAAPSWVSPILWFTPV